MDKQNSRSLQELREISLRMSEQIIESTTRAGSGHPSSSLSAIDVLACLYFRPVMKYDPAQPQWPDRDRFILSKGHGAPALYSALANAGYFDVEQLQTLRRFGSPLEGHPNMRLLAGVEASTGSLGQGLSLGIGHALAARLDQKSYRVYVMTGDGELQEGQVWEGVMYAASQRLGNLTAIVDYNKYQQTHAVEEVMPALYPPGEKWRAFGWHVQQIDGHDMDQIAAAFDNVQEVHDQPQVIIANTVKGKNLSTFSSDESSHMHGKPLKAKDVEKTIQELKAQYR